MTSTHSAERTAHSVRQKAQGIRDRGLKGSRIQGFKIYAQEIQELKKQPNEHNKHK